MSAAHQVLDSRIYRFQVFQAAGVTTPRFTAQLESTTNIYREYLKLESAELQEAIPNVRALMNNLKEYWARLFPDFDSAALLCSRMSLHRDFLEKKLLEDYLEMPFVVSQEIVWMTRSQGDPATRKRVAQVLDIKVEEMDEWYQERVTDILHEMMLDQDHVERKLRASAARDGQPANDVQPLIDNCQWSALGTMLVKDRILVERLFASLDKENTGKKIINGIDRVQKKYFDTLLSPERFVISSRAGALSAKAAMKGILLPSDSAPPPYSDVTEEDQEVPDKHVEKEIQEHPKS